MSSNTAACQKLGILCVWSWSSQDVSRIPGLPEVPPAGIHSPGVFVIPRPAIQGSHWPEGAACSKPSCQSRASLQTRRPKRGGVGAARRRQKARLHPRPLSTALPADPQFGPLAGWEGFPTLLLSPALLLTVSAVEDQAL